MMYAFKGRARDEGDYMTELTDDCTAENTPTSASSAQSMSLFRQLLINMNPAVCFAPGGSGGCVNPLDDEEEVVDYEYTVKPLIKDLRHEGKPRTSALRKLFKLTDKDRHQNRVPVLCSGSCDFMGALLPCIAPDSCGHDRRQALLLLNNLCIPMENKKFLIRGEDRDKLLTALLAIFPKRLAETHIAAACLYNLSFLEEAKAMLLAYIPPSDLERTLSARSEYSFHSPTDNKNSLMRVVEEMVSHFTPYMRKATQHGLSTVEAASIRWSMALMRNLASNRDNAGTLALTTKFPNFATQYLQESDRDLVHWTRDSLEDSCLLFLLLLVQSGDDSCKSIDTQELRTALIKVGEFPGIHGVRAGVILQRLEEANETARFHAEHLIDANKQGLDEVDLLEDEKKEDDRTLASF